MSDGLEVNIVPPTISAESGDSSGDADEPGIQPLDSLWEGRIETGDYPHVAIHATLDTDSGALDGASPDRFTVYESGERQDIESVEGSTSALDLAFVFDDTGSMTGEIDAAKRRVTNLTDEIEKQGIDARYALVSFKDDTEIDVGFTADASALKSKVERLRATGGGDGPECNFDAIETALSLDFRDDASQVFVDITDAPSHYAGDGSGYADYTIDDVADDLQDAGVSFIAVSPGLRDERASVQVLAERVGGLWTDIHGTDFDTVLDRITALLTSTYVIRYHTCTPPGTSREVSVEYDDPEHGTDDDSSQLRVPERFDLPPECEDAEKTCAGPAMDTHVSRDLPPRGGETTLEVEIEPRRGAASLPRNVVISVDTRATSAVDGGVESIQSAVEAVRDVLDSEDTLAVQAVDASGVESVGLAPPGELSPDRYDSLLSETATGSSSQLSRAIDSAQRDLTTTVSTGPSVDRIVLITDGAGLRDGDDAADGYRALAQSTATAGVTIDVGAVGPDVTAEHVAALADGSGRRLIRIEDSEQFEPFLLSTVESAADTIVPDPKLHVKPGVGFTTKAGIDGEDPSYCRLGDDDGRRRVVPPVTEADSTTVVHLPELRAGETQHVLLPFLGSRQTPGVDHDLASVDLLGRHDEPIASRSASVRYVDDSDGRLRHPDIQKRLTDSAVDAALARDDISKARAEAKSGTEDADVRKQLLRQIDRVEAGSDFLGEQRAIQTLEPDAETE